MVNTTVKILLDTNFLMIPAQFRVDIFNELERICDFPYTICTLTSIKDELKKIIQEQKKKYREAAKIALELIENKKIEVLEPISEGFVDDQVLEIAESEGMCVATLDKELKKRIREKGLPLVSLRGKKYLKIEGTKTFKYLSKIY